ncbi:MAG: hypothetical protein CVU97_07540, partial [Firmicutes bacterium HGW-Firmicutes-21]
FICLSAIPANAQQTAVSLGKTYQFITPVSEGYPDNAAYKLTNGVYAAPVTTGETAYYYKSDEYVGLNQSAVDENGNFVIILDLDSIMDDLMGFEISYLNETSIGIYAPSSVTFYVSDTRNGVYTPIGTKTIDEPTTAGISQSLKTRVTADGPVSGQYIMIEIEHKGTFEDEQGNPKTAGWVFLDEISVFGVDGGNGNETQAETNDLTNDITENAPPVTGDDFSVVAYSIIALASVIMIIGIFIKRKASHLK